jgi:tryptophanyl-tRNA synthetase
LDHYTRLARENAKDIIAVGFNPSKTYIFSNRNERKRGNPGLMDNIINMMDYTPVNVVRSAFGLNKLSLTTDEMGTTRPAAEPCSVGMLSWPIYQSVPSFSNSFQFIFGNQEAMCLVPMAVDQSVYFRLCRDYADYAKLLKPAEFHSEFLVGLGGIDSKMSTTEGIPPIFLTDTEEQVRTKIQRCFSGGRETKALHLELGADLMIDVPYQWLLIFMEDDHQLEEIAHRYGPPKNGMVRMMTSEVKKIMLEVVMTYLRNHQQKRDAITEDVLDHYFNPHRSFDMGRVEREPMILLSDDEYARQGANFDRYFGLYETRH